MLFFFFQAEDGIRDADVTGVQTCALPICPLWPIDKEGEDRCWAFVSTSMQKLITAGHVFLGKYNAKLNSWTINYRIPKKTSRKLKTVWWETIHDAGTHGTQLLKKYLGQGGLFPFPKSVYAVRDCIAAV